MTNQNERCIFSGMPSEFRVSRSFGQHLKMAAADADKGLSGKNDEKFAIMRWLNDKNKVSVLSTKYIIEPQKGVYYPADIGISKFPGSRKIWNFRILNIGGKITGFNDICMILLVID